MPDPLDSDIRRLKQLKEAGAAAAASSTDFFRERQREQQQRDERDRRELEQLFASFAQRMPRDTAVALGSELGVWSISMLSREETDYDDGRGHRVIYTLGVTTTGRPVLLREGFKGHFDVCRTSRLGGPFNGSTVQGIASMFRFGGTTTEQHLSAVRTALLAELIPHVGDVD